MNDVVRAHFSKNIEDYDYGADKVVFKNDELHECLVNTIPFDTNAGINVLDIGCGTGHGMLLALEKFPNANVTGVDFSHKMILRADDKLKEFSGRYRLIEKNFTELEFDDKCNAVISAIAIHNVTHEQKDELFGKIYNSLESHGVFINGDLIAGESSSVDQQYKREYRKYLEENLDGKELQVWLKHAFEDDTPMKLSQQFELLKRYGFQEPQLVWQFNNEAVYVARK